MTSFKLIVIDALIHHVWSLN